MEGTPSPTPGDQPADEQVSTPPSAEQAPPVAAAAVEDKPAAEPDLKLLQAAFTKGQQINAVVLEELGLDRKATRDDIRAALQALKAGPPPEDEAEEVDPRIAAAEERAFAAELRVQEAIYTPIYGADFTAKALAVINKARTSNDPEQLIGALAGLIEDYRAPSAPGEAPPPAPSASATPPMDTGLPEGDQAPSARPVPSAGRRESGTVDAVRGIFAGLGIGSAPKA